MNQPLLWSLVPSPFLDSSSYLNPDLYNNLNRNLLRFLGYVQAPLPINQRKYMNNFYFIGVDVSKKKLDVCLMCNNQVLHEEIIPNNSTAIISQFRAIQQEYEIDGNHLIICAEYTGQYTYPLTCSCSALGIKLWLENPSSIKYSSGSIQRGKDDKTDAKRIAIYAMRFHDKARYYKHPTKEIERLKQLEAERSLYVKDLNKYQAQLNDQAEYMDAKLFKEKSKRLKKLIRVFEERIEELNTEMNQVIHSCEVLYHQYCLLQSVEGVGAVVATNMIVVTEGFTRFDNARQFNCYAGLAPFQYTSGSSQHSKARVSHRANKEMKALLHLAAMAVIRKKTSELKDYYLRKTEEGKSKMSVINAVRAKIVARMFAVIKKNDFYQPILA